MREEAIAATEGWFRRRGVPHFIQNYNAREDILTRALPFLVVALLVEAFLFVNPSLPWWVNVLVVGFVLLFILGSWAGINFLRGRRLLALPERVGWVEVLVYLFLPGSLAATLDLNWTHLPSLVILNAVILAVIFVVVSYGLVPILGWAGWLLVRNLRDVAGLFARALPLLLLFVTFLFITEEVWRLAGGLEGPLLGLLAASSAWSRAPSSSPGCPARSASWRRSTAPNGGGVGAGDARGGAGRWRRGRFNWMRRSAGGSGSTRGWSRSSA